MKNWLFRYILFTSILLSGSLYPIVFGGVIPTILILVAVVILLFFKFSLNLKLFKLFTIYLLVILSILFVHFFLNGSNNHENEFFKFIFRVITAFSILFIYSLYKREIVTDFIWVMNLLLFHSIINFLLGFVLVQYLVPVNTERINCLTYKHVFFYFSESNSIGFSFLRNQGVFWEPGVLSVFLNILLFVYLFIKPNMSRAILVFIMVFTTFSTTGLVLSVLLFIVKYNKRIRSSFAALFIAIAALLVLIPVLIGNINDKVVGNGQASFYLRTFDLLISLQMVTEHPIKGIGFGGEVYKMVQEQNNMFLQSDLFEGRGNTNSIVYIFIAFGVPIAIYILYLLYNQKVFDHPSKYLGFFLLVISLSTEPLISSVLFLIILFSSYFNPQSKFNV
jgi:hypothetical protein